LMAAQVLMLKRVPEAALSVVEAISEWRKCNLPLGKGGGKSDPTRRKRQQQQQQARSHHPPRPFIWRGKNVLLALPTALEFLEDVQPLREWLTAELRVQPQPRSRASQCRAHPFCRNPFLSAASILAADDDSGAGTATKTGVKPKLASTGRDREWVVDTLRLKQAERTIIAEERHFGRSSAGGGADISSARQWCCGCGVVGRRVAKGASAVTGKGGSAGRSTGRVALLPVKIKPLGKATGAKPLKETNGVKPLKDVRQRVGEASGTAYGKLHCAGCASADGKQQDQGQESSPSHFSSPPSEPVHARDYQHEGGESTVTGGALPPPGHTADVPRAGEGGRTREQQLMASVYASHVQEVAKAGADSVAAVRLRNFMEHAEQSLRQSDVHWQELGEGGEGGEPSQPTETQA
jgi:hypothetical protein